MFIHLKKSKLKAFLKYYIKDNLSLLIKRVKLMLFTKKTPILIFTMAKVGSLSVYFSLKNSLKRNSIFHFHSLDEDEVNEGVKMCFDNNIYPGSKSPVFLINSKIIEKQKKVRIISLFRDPLERNISAFFDAFEFYTNSKPEKYEGSIEDLLKLFHEKLPHDYPINWFEKQFFEGLNLNVYNYGFNKDIGYQIIKNDNTEILLISSHLTDELKELLIKDFCGLKEFKLKNQNISSNKDYATLYQNFKNEANFDESYLNELYESKYVKHYLQNLIFLIN